MSGTIHEDFTCPRCKARTGMPCTSKRKHRPYGLPCHTPRWDKLQRALHRGRPLEAASASMSG